MDNSDHNKELEFHSRLLRRAEEMAGIGHWRLDVEKNHLYWSDEIFRIHGIDKADGVPHIENAVNAYHPDDRDRVSGLLAKAIEKGTDFSFELRLVRPNGDIRHVKSFGECEVNEYGKTKAVFGIFSDITDFVQRENEVKAVNNKLKNIIENIPDVVFIKDENFVITEANNKFLELYPEDMRDGVIGTTTLEKYDSDQVELFLEQDRLALQKGYTETIEDIDFPNGERRILETKKVGFKDAEGNQFLLGLGRDVTDILMNEKLLKSILNTSVNGFLTIDETGIVKTYNKGAEKIFGYSEDEVLGQNIKMLMPSKIANEHDGYLSEYKNTGKKNIIGVGREVVGQRKDGSPVPLYLSIDECRVGNQLYYAGILQDLSGTKVIEKALADSEFTREAYADASSDGYWDWMLQEDYEYMSPRFWEMMGYDPATKKPHPSEWQDIIFPEDLELALSNFEKHVQSKGDYPFTQEVRYKKADGSIIWVICKGHVIEWDKDDQPIRMVGTHTDITKMKLIQEQLLQSNIELERFAYIASHDLQEPLRMVTNFTGLLEEEYGDQLNDEAKQYIHYATDAANRMHTLVDDLLDYSRLGHTDDEMKDIDSGKHIDMACMYLKDAITEKDATISYNNLSSIHFNPLRFTRLMQNLIGNGIKYCNTKPHIEITCEDQDDAYLFAVKDNGIGMKPDYHEKIFEIFERLHGKNEYKGTGIGLAICKRIIDGAGGKIWVESAEGKGSIFKFTIPK